ncbi:hypothetical protein AAG570_005967 [Ranatra chinensis]|uniref:Uncharacterized protein n=1 Tax=Ranatra chinensis TaxID=642074 RepID=A0ABD0XXR8_9HEMI
MASKRRNWTLRDRVEALSDDNARLKRSLQEADRKLKLKCRAPSPVKGIGRSSDMAANKIVQLSKRVRELNAELAASHRRANSAEAKLLKHQTEPPAQEIKRSEPKESSEDLKKLTEKFNALNIKLCESRNQVQQLKRELKIAHKVSSEFKSNFSQSA